MFLKNSERFSPGSGRVDSSKTQMHPFLTEVILENGLTNMFEATDYDSLHQMSHFFEAFTDVMCGNRNEQENATLFTEYFEPSHCLGSYKKSN